MTRITEITKRDIEELFRDGLEIDEIFISTTVKYYYYGCLEEIEFLKRLYSLSKLPSFDSRLKNAEEDIRRHTLANDDWLPCWVFEDERFPLKNGSDEEYLRFLCEVFHPAVRVEKGYWEKFLSQINTLLQSDGYELYSSAKLSNRDVYDWRNFYPEDNSLFIPYSQRNQARIKRKELCFSIPRKARMQIFRLLDKYNITYSTTDETGWNYNTSISKDVFSDIQQFYTPKCFNEQNEYVETRDLQDFILFGSPYQLLDAIELFAKHTSLSDFESQCNSLLQLNELALIIKDGKIDSRFSNQIINGDLTLIQEVGLKDLITDAGKYYEQNNLQIAVEKIWDAFERLKTYYPELDKKKSVSRIIEDMSCGKQPFRELFEKEFSELTKIGNEYRIRHHETSKIDIVDFQHYEYFYKRCLSLILTAIQFLHGFA